MARWRQPFQHVLPPHLRRPETAAGKLLAGRFGVRPQIADKLAELAGFGGERGR